MSFRLAQKWLQECLDSHEDCQLGPVHPGFRPTRVIEILETSPSYHVRLVQPTTETNYLALSYCWGCAQAMLTKKNENEWKMSLPWAELSQTIKDSIHVTAKLGFKYLWVDALCIIQDDAADKFAEIAQMARIYSAATLTIVASSATAATDGILQDRKFTDFPNQVFELPVRCADGQLGIAILFRPPSGASTHEYAEPLNTRGWALQERLLSNRSLDFRSLQLRWSCQTVTTSHVERYFDGWNSTLGDVEILGDPSEDPHSFWLETVYRYTLRKLTVPTDRILAISGIAEVLSLVIEGEYWAGLWESNLARCLMWRSVPADTKFSFDLSCHSASKSATLLSRPAEYQGPSWSWVSVNARAFYEGMGTDSVDIRINVLGCDIKLADDSAKYGAVKMAHLRIHGRTMPGTLHYIQDVTNPFRESWKLDAGLTKGTAYATGDALEPEFISPTMLPIRVLLVEVIRRVSNQDAISEGLILRQLPSQQFSRLGRFAFFTDFNPALKTPQNTWFDEYEEETLCLI